MKKQNDLLKTLILVFAVLIALTAIGDVVYYVVASSKLKAISLTPDFAQTEIEVGTQYSFTISVTPKKASTKKIKCIVDDPTSTFELSDDGKKVVLTTGVNEGSVTVYVEVGDIKSEVHTFSVIDPVARAQAEAEAAAAEAEAQAQAEAAAAEAAAAEEQTLYVKCTGDNVRVRAEDNTDCDILGNVKQGEAFEKVEEVGEWTHIKYKGQDGYMKSEYLTEISEEEFNNAEASPSEPEKKEEKKEEKKQEKNNDEQQDNATQSQEEAEAKAKADADAAALQELAEQLAQAATSQPSTAGLTAINCTNGTCYVTPAQVDKIHATWDFAGDAIEMAGHHSIGDLEAVIGPTQH